MRCTKFSTVLIALSSLLAIGGTSTCSAADGPRSVSFNRDIRPLLADRCFACHGPDEHDRQADLRLDQAEGEHGAYRTSAGVVGIKPGDLEASEVWSRIRSSDPYVVMPPPDSGKKPLSEQEQELIRLWILDGAEYEGYWAFAPIERPEAPKAADPSWSDQTIDLFVGRRLQEEGLEPKPPADRRTLIRRLTLDLTGLPPTRQEIADFLSDNEPEAYERLVDRLLAKPQYGEHMARYWLDLVRFADTNGIHHDHFRDLSPYRDWVIRAFNENLPYDRFVKYQLAGDLYPEPTRDQLVASGFNRLHLIIDRGTMLPEESHARNVIDRVTSVGTAFMGMTVQCAVCHDHKFDPLTMRDFYQLYAFFNNIDAAPETGGRSGPDFRRGLQPPYILLSTPEQDAERASLAKTEQESANRLNQLRQQAKTASGDEKKKLQAKVKDAEQQLAAARKAKQDFDASIPGAMVMKEREEIRPAHIFIRGAYDKLGDPVQRDTPGFLPPLNNDDDGPASRLDLAEWFTSPEHPLTARVAVNRFWQQLFGVGIVQTSEDLGAQGKWPSHPDLLNYLAWRFRERGWNVKALMREMVLSATYRQSSKASPEEFARDPQNRLLARGSRYRLDAEVIRDQILATSGMLVETMYGKSVKPPQPEGLWKAVSLPSSFPNRFVADSGEKRHRRSVYTFWKRGLPPPQMTILDAPTREACIARRERTNTPLQALLLMNEPEYLKAASRLAATVLQQPERQRIAFAYETITAQLPDDDDAATLADAVKDLEQLYSDKPELAEALVGDQRVEVVTPSLHAAWTMVVNAIYNLDITKQRQ